MALRNPAFGATDKFRDDWDKLATIIIREIKKRIKQGKTVNEAVSYVFARYDINDEVKDLLKTAVSTAVTKGAGQEISVNVKGFQKWYLNKHYEGDKLTLSQRTSKLKLKGIITKTIQEQFVQNQGINKLAKSLTDKQLLKGDIANHIKDLERKARRVMAGDTKAVKAYVTALERSSKQIDRLARDGAPFQRLKKAYASVLKASANLSEKGLDSAIDRAVRAKARYNAERIARTESARAYGVGVKTRAQEDEDVVALKWNLSTRHPRYDICDIHADTNLYNMGPGVYPIDDLPAYPAHPHCVLPGNKVVLPGKLMGATEAFYDGPCIEIIFFDGSKMSVTTNHPILTTDGWVPAKDINEGSDIVRCTNAERIASIISPNENHVPTRIEDIFSSFKKLVHSSNTIGFSKLMKASSEAFHGDGKFIKKEVNVINMKSFLPSNLKITQKIISNLLIFRDVFIDSINSMLFNAVSMIDFRFNRYFATYSGTPSLSGPISSSFNIGTVFPFLKLSSRTRSSCPSETGVILRKSNIESKSVDVKSASEFVDRFSSYISTIKPVKIRNFMYSGHVYDLQCDPYALYTINGVLLHNCMCVLTNVHDVKLKKSIHPKNGEDLINNLSAKKRKTLLGVKGEERFRRNPKNWRNEVPNYKKPEKIPSIPQRLLK